MKLISLTSVIVVLLVGISSGRDASRTAMAADQSTGKVAGVILDANDARIVKASITMWNGETTRKTKSGDQGEFEVSLPAGSY